MTDNPDLIAAFKTAVAKQKSGHRSEAEAIYRQILAEDPNIPEAWHLLGVAAYQSGDFQLALQHIARALDLNPGLVNAHSNLGLIYQEQGMLAEAEASYRRAIELRPEHAQAYNNLGNVFRERKQFDEAIFYHQRALQIQPHFPEACYNLALSYQDQCRYDEALATYERVMALKPDYAEAHYNRALILLMRGDYERGWPEYGWRVRCKEFAPGAPGLPLPPVAADFVGKTVLLHTEQGLGDTLQFVRYAPLVKQQAKTVILRCGKELIPLVGRCKGIDQLVSKEESLPAFDVKASLMYLPLAFHTTQATIPREVPYLFGDPALIGAWRRTLPGDGVRVGIAWQGNPQFKLDQLRSIPLAEFAPLSEIEDVRLISLQKVHGTEQIASVRDRFQVVELGEELDESAGAFMDTAAVMMNLDLVITSDTAIAHLAGGLGVPVWLGLSTTPEWRWMQNRTDSPWYPTMRLFRQKRDDDWRDVFEEMKTALLADRGGNNSAGGRVGPV